MFNTEALTGVVTTFLGAFLALGLTYAYDKYKTKESERSERRKVLATVRYELARNLEAIQRCFTEQAEYDGLEEELNAEIVAGAGHLAVIPDIRLERAAFDTAIFSGKLFLLEEDTLETVSENYRRVDVVNRSSDDLRSIARGPVSKDYLPTIQSLVAAVQGTMTTLSESLPKAIEQLEKRRLAGSRQEA